MINKLFNCGFRPYDKSELFSKINTIEIFKNGEQVITKYFDRVINTSTVSKKYEIFDIKSFLQSKIDLLENNFNITHYKLSMTKGVQELTLLSDAVDINGSKFHKAFFILNSSDKSRCLNMNLGLYREDNNSYFISSIKNLSLYKKHLVGLTQLAEEASGSIDVETFNDQIKSIKSLIGERIMLSKIREIIIDKDLKINHRKFDAFKNQLTWSSTDKVELNKDQLKTLRTFSEDLKIDQKNDFSIDAYKVFNCYIQVFSKQDSYIVKKETEKILNITQCFIRDEKINSILEIV